ncbi:MAG: class I SAM-dependent methyltransferase [Anaerolineae bacterium]
MREETVRQLLELTQAFYNAQAASFAQSRTRPQPGFFRLLDHLPDPCHSLLDVGCGDGRFGRFLQEHAAVEWYVGVDFSAELLHTARAATAGDFFQRELSTPGCLAGLGEFDLVVCLAALHHIPARANRLRLLGEIKQHVRPGGRVFLSTWQFMDSERQRRKITPWSKVNIPQDDLEPDDYLLTWNRDGSALRYVCFIDEKSLTELTDEAGLHVLTCFRADGKEGNLGLYMVLGV